VKAGRTTNIASIIPLLGAFVGAAVVMGLLSVAATSFYLRRLRGTAE